MLYHVSLERAVFRLDAGTLWAGLPEPLPFGFHAEPTPDARGRVVDLERAVRVAQHRSTCRFAIGGLRLEHRVLFVLLDGFFGFKKDVASSACVTAVSGKRTLRALEREGMIRVTRTKDRRNYPVRIEVTLSGVQFLEKIDGAIVQGHNLKHWWPVLTEC
jgi:hypothetical protein